MFGVVQMLSSKPQGGGPIGSCENRTIDNSQIKTLEKNVSFARRCTAHAPPDGRSFLCLQGNRTFKKIYKCEQFFKKNLIPFSWRVSGD